MIHAGFRNDVMIMQWVMVGGINSTVEQAFIYLIGSPFCCVMCIYVLSPREKEGVYRQ